MATLVSQDRTAVHSEFAADPEYRELLEMFAEALPERQHCLTAAFRAADWPTLKTLAHQLKGAGGGFGFRGLTDLAAELEAACQLGRTENIAVALDRLLGYMARITL